MSRVSLQTLLDRSDKNMAKGTHKVVRESALELIKRAYKEGINVQISEGHRSNTRQNQLYAQGRTTPGNIVTNARAGQSLHNYGVAIDFFLTNENGSQAIWTVNSNWRRVAQIGKSLGFEWGGDWTSFKDYPHLQMTDGLSLKDLQAGKRPNLTSNLTGKTPKPSKPTSKPTSGGSVVDYLKSKKIDSSYNNRKKLAAKHGIKNYKGTEAQNNTLLSKLKGTSNVSSKPSSKPAKKKVAGKTADIQRKLNEYKVNNIAVDNLRGPKTYKALVKAYQYELNRQFNAGLVVDGFPGAKTDNAAVTLYESKTYGNLAYLTQAMLYFKGYSIAVDGYWQSDSVKVTKLYQRDVKLTADGKPGKATYKKLIRF